MSRAKTISTAIEQKNEYAIYYEINGTAPLLQNKFSQKAIDEMLRKHMGLSVVRDKKIPSECIKNATIYNDDGMVCIPPTAIKKAILSASTQVKSFKKTQLRTSIFIEGGSIPIKYSRMVEQMDMVRTSGIGRTPDVRFRPRFEGWSAMLGIIFSEIIPVETISDLLIRAGKVGVGEWRPEHDGTYGTFEVSRVVSDADEIKKIRNSCRSLIPSLVIPDWARDVELSPEILDKIANLDIGGE